MLLASSCSTAGEGTFGAKKGDLLDPDLGLSRSDYKNMFDKEALRNKQLEDSTGKNPSEPPIPALAEVLASPEPPKLAETKLVSVAVTEDVPLKDVLIEVARLADVDIEVDAGITGGISFRAKERPFNEVIERISDLAGLRYSVKHGVLRIERDTPYIQIYSLDLLNIERNSNGNIDVNTSSGSAGGGSSGSNASNVNSGSKSSITLKTDSDFWKQFEESVKQILNYKEQSRTSATSIASQIPPEELKAKGTGGAGSLHLKETVTPLKVSPTGSTTPTGAAKTTDTIEAFYVLNKQASTLTVSATSKQHAILKRFIDKIQDNASAQVLIEAKIVEVSLDDEYRSGIDWARFNTKTGANAKGFLPFVRSKFPITNPSNGVNPFTLTFQDNALDLAATVTLTEQFGTTRTLSSPRLHATNNQQALLTFADNLVFFDLKFDVTKPTFNSTGGIQTQGSVTANATVHTVPIGILLSLQPSINKETNEITLSVRPTLSRILGYTEDPSVPINLASSGLKSDIKSQVPVIQVRELDSVMKVKSGQVMVIGGLMENMATNNDTGVPGASSVPYLGNLFKSVEKGEKSKELVIFIKATIIGSNGSATETDKNFYNKFTKDSRPLFNNDATISDPSNLPAASESPASVIPPAINPAQPIDIPPLPPVSSQPANGGAAYPDFPSQPAPMPEIPPLAPLLHQ